MHNRRDKGQKENDMKKNKALSKRQFSISTQLAVTFIIVLIMGAVFCVFINRVFIQKFYLQNKVVAIEESYDYLCELFVDKGAMLHTDEFDVEFEQICNTNDISVIVVDSSLGVVKSSMQENDKVLQRLYSYIFKNDPNYLFKEMQGEVSANGIDGTVHGFGTDLGINFYDIDSDKLHDQHGLMDRELDMGEHYVVRLSTDPRLSKDYVELMGSINDDMMIMIRAAISGIKINANISNRFLLYVIMISVALGMILIWLVTNRVTKPIKQLSELSVRMTNLDFTAKYEGDDNNEVGNLGIQMNRMSETLENTISELKNANARLMVDLKRREEMDEMRSEFISNVSHELKTPIAIIQGYAEGLKDAVNDDPESREYYCEVIIDEAVKMNRMVKNLLALNQLESGGNSLQYENFDIVELIKNQISSAEVLISQSGARVELSAKDSVYVWADEYKIEEVFMNYLTNAINHAAGDKTITVSVKHIGNDVRVTVANTGEPIPEASLSRIWEKFYKVDKARTREYGGSGVGLSIVKAIMEAHGKDYGVENTENGVAFYFELDCK